MPASLVQIESYLTEAEAEWVARRTGQIFKCGGDVAAIEPMGAAVPQVIAEGEKRPMK